MFRFKIDCKIDLRFFFTYKSTFCTLTLLLFYLSLGTVSDLMFIIECVNRKEDGCTSWDDPANELALHLNVANDVCNTVCERR